MLRDRFYDAETLVRIAADHHDADLDRVDIAVMDLAVKVARDGTAVTAIDFAELRGCGLADVEILQIVLAAAARCFFSTVIDAVGAEPDPQYRTSLESELQRLLVVGRPIANAAAPAAQDRWATRCELRLFWTPMFAALFRSVTTIAKG